MKRFSGFFLAAVLLFSLSSAVFAAGYGDVGGTWYADAVDYVTEHGLMDPAGDRRFAPDADATRADLAVALYRAAGSPQAWPHSFNDIPADSSYASAAAWAQANGVIAGYSSGGFGGGDSITREQIVTILWRYAGSPAPGASRDFTDEGSISSYAAQAVDWSRENGVVSGYDDGRFAPQAYTTRAQLAVILRGFLTRDQQSDPSQPGGGSKALVVYFSATGSTRRVAQVISDTLDADILELEPVDPYTSADLNYSSSSSRVVYEHEHPEAQDVQLVTAAPDNWEEYDTVFIGYPIWWGIAAWPVNSFVTANDFTGKTVVPFCTSASSGLGDSGELLEELAGTGRWLEGRNFYGRESEDTIAGWATGLDLD